MADAFDPYHQWLGIPPSEQPPTLYRLLGTAEFECDQNVIANAADQRMAHLRSFQLGAHARQSQRLLNEVAAARVTLLCPAKKAEYDRWLRAKREGAHPKVPGEPHRPVPPPAASVSKPSQLHSRPPSSGPMRWGIWAGTGVLALILLGGIIVLATQRGEGDAARSQPARAEGAANPPKPITRPDVLQATLVFDATPEELASAKLWVNGALVPLPRTEPREIHCRPGAYQVRLEREGFEPFEKTIALEAGEKAVIPPPRTPLAVLVLDWPKTERGDAQLEVDGNRLPIPTGPNDPDEIRIPHKAGIVRIWISRRGYYPFDQTIELASGEQRHVPVELPPLDETSIVLVWPEGVDVRNASLTIDGQVWRQLTPEPETRVLLTPGEHTVEVRRDDSRPFVWKGDLAAGRSERIEVVLAPIDEPAPPIEPPSPTAGPTPEQQRVLEAFDAREAQWRESARVSAARAAAWDFAGALAALEGLRFDDSELEGRLQRRRDELRRMAALKERMIEAINTASPPWLKSQLEIRGLPGRVTAADHQGVTSTLDSGKMESLAWGELGTKAPSTLLRLVVDPTRGEDCTSAGLLARELGQFAEAETYLKKASTLGEDMTAHRAALADAELLAARRLIESGEFGRAKNDLGGLETKYAGTAWLATRRPVIEAALAVVEWGIREEEADRLYEQAAELYRAQKWFDLRPLVAKLKKDYSGTRAVTDASRSPPFDDLETAVRDLGEFITVSQDGKSRFKTLQAAIDAAPPRSVIQIEDGGTYNEKIRITKERLTIRGKEGTWPLLTSVGAVTNFPDLIDVLGDHLTLERLVIAHAGAEGGSKHCIWGHSSESAPRPITIRSAIIFSPKCYAIDSGAFEIEGCLVIGSQTLAWPLVVTDSIWIGGANPSFCRFENVLLLADWYAGLGSEFRLCTFVKALRLKGGSQRVTDCIFHSVESDTPGVVIDSCCYFGNPPFVDEARPGKDCEALPPALSPPPFPDILNYKPQRMGSARGKAMDRSAAVGFQPTPEIIEITKVAIALRTRGIIKF